MSNIDKQALIAKIKKQTESFDTVVIREDEANALLDELEAKDRRIAEPEAQEVVVNISPPVIGRAYSALNRVWTEQEVRKACELAGIKLHIAAAGKGEAS